MAKYSIEYSCGHSGTINLIGKGDIRQWRLEKESEKVCPDCYELQLQQEIKIANEKAKEFNLIPLEGTERQIGWANTIRLELINNIEKNTQYGYLKNVIHYLKQDSYTFNYIKDLVDKDKFKLDFLSFIYQIKDSKFYIDNRNDLLEKAVLKFFDSIKANEPKKVAERKMEKDIRDELTVFPIGSKYKEPCEIIFQDDKIKLYFIKDEKFIEIAKSKRFSWSGVWYRTLNGLTGSHIDRMSEIGNELLKNGIPIYINDKNILDKAIKGDFKPEIDNWIIVPKDYPEYFKIIWDGKNDAYYKASRKIESTWNSGGTLIKGCYYQEVEKFAEKYKFYFSDQAKKLLETEKNKTKNEL